jgi:hypothetical protein
MKKRRIYTREVYVDYNKVDKTLNETVYFKKPTTRHTNPEIVFKKAILIVWS